MCVRACVCVYVWAQQKTVGCAKSPCTCTHARARARAMLAARHPIPVLDAVGFDEPSHTYTALGKRVPISVTKLTSRHFEAFDADRVINTNFSKWRVNASSPYHSVIAESASEEQAKAAIKAGWDANGLKARALGTRLHKIVEDLLNGEHVERAVDDPVRAERRAFEAWRAEWAAERHLAPYRTELPLYGVDDEGVPVIAGMIDALFRNPTASSCSSTEARQALRPRRTRATGSRATAPARARRCPTTPTGSTACSSRCTRACSSSPPGWTWARAGTSCGSRPRTATRSSTPIMSASTPSRTCCCTRSWACVCPWPSVPGSERVRVFQFFNTRKRTHTHTHAHARARFAPFRMAGGRSIA